MKVKVAAIRVVWDLKEDPESVMARGFALAEEAARQGAKYIVLPEGFLDARNPKDAMIPGPLTDRVVETAKRFGVCVCAGIFERDTPFQKEREGKLDNFMSAVVAGPEGLLSVHRKVDVVVDVQAPSNREGMLKTDLNCWSGGDFEMHSAGEIERIGILICRDSFSNWAWSRVLSQDPQIIFHPNHRSSITLYGPNLPATAKKYGLPIVAPDGQLKSESLIVDRDGTILEFEDKAERALVAEVTLADRHPNYVAFEKVDNRPDNPVKFTKKLPRP